MAGLNPYLATIARNLPKVARSLGFQARVTSGYRSYSKQLWLYKRYLAGLQPYPVNPPGTSEHEKGLALDVVSSDLGKLVALLQSVGLSWAGPDDPVHFSGSGLKSNPRAKSVGSKIKAAQESWEAGPGSAIPGWLGYLPIIGTAARVAKSPVAESKSQGRKVLDILEAVLWL